MQVSRIPLKPKREACFFLIHRQISHTEYEVVYESEFQNLNSNGLTFDVSSIPLKHFVVDQPNFKCQLQLLTLKKKGVMDRETALQVGAVEFRLSDLCNGDMVMEPQLVFDCDSRKKSAERMQIEFLGLR